MVRHIKDLNPLFREIEVPLYRDILYWGGTFSWMKIILLKLFYLAYIRCLQIAFFLNLCVSSLGSITGHNQLINNLKQVKKNIYLTPSPQPGFFLYKLLIWQRELLPACLSWNEEERWFLGRIQKETIYCTAMEDTCSSEMSRSVFIKLYFFLQGCRQVGRGVGGGFEHTPYSNPLKVW